MNAGTERLQDSGLIKIRVILRHNKMRLEDITENLGLNPDAGGSCGEPIPAAQEAGISSVYPSTFWSKAQNISACDNPTSVITQTLTLLEEKQNFIETFMKTGGTGLITIDLIGRPKAAFVLNANLLNRLSSLDFSLGFETFK